MRASSLARCGIGTAAGLLGLGVALLGGAASAEPPGDAPLGRAEFARERPVEGGTADALQVIHLDAAVYRGSVEPRLADLRVFDRHGEPLAHAIQRLAEERPVAPESVLLPLYRLPEGLPAREILAPGAGYRVDVGIGPDRARVTVEPTGEGARAEERVRGYLIDTKSLDEEIVGLELGLGPSERNFVVPVKVEGSDDLVRYQVVSAAVAVAQLAEAESRLERHRIRFPATRHDYLRITWPADRAPLDIRQARAELASTRPPVERLRIHPAGRALDDEPGAFVYDLGGQIPVDRVQVDLGRRDSVAAVRLYSGASAEGPWLWRHRGLVYRIGDDAGTRNPEIPWRVTRERYIKLVVETTGGGAGGRMPGLEAAWRPEQLLYIDRGERPASVAYGRVGAQPSGFDADELLRITGYDFSAAPPLRPTARLGRERTLAGDSALEPDRSIPPRTLALWAVLLVCVAAVVAMSVRLVRELG